MIFASGRAFIVTLETLVYAPIYWSWIASIQNGSWEPTTNWCVGLTLTICLFKKKFHIIKRSSKKEGKKVARRILSFENWYIFFNIKKTIALIWVDLYVVHLVSATLAFPKFCLLESFTDRLKQKRGIVLLPAFPLITIAHGFQFLYFRLLTKEFV